LAAATSSTREPSRVRQWLRALLAGPCALALTALIIAVMPFWVPKGTGGVDHIAFPLFFMPAIWVVIFFYALLDRSLGRVAIVMTVIAVIHLIALRGVLSG
jgi:ABC-type sugar transport system permease subunit